MTQIAATVRDPEPAKCYFISNPEHGCWAIFTVCQPLALLQVASNFGTYMARWEGREDEFLHLFTERHPGYTMGYFGSSAEVCGAFSALYQNDRLGHNLNGIRDYLWPLFIEKLKAEQTPAPTEEPTTEERTWYPIKRVAVTVDVDGCTAEVAMADFEDGGRKVWANLEDRTAQIAKIAASQLKEMAPDLPYSPSDPEEDEDTPTIQG